MPPEEKPTTDMFERFSISTTKWIGSKASLVLHTIFFVASFVLILFGVDVDTVLLILTTIVSLEAIYLSIFIQMTVNRHARRLKAVSRDIEEIQEDVEEIQEDVEEIQEDVEEIEKDVDEIQEDVEEIGEDVEDMTEEDNEDDDRYKKIEETLRLLSKEIRELPRPGQEQKK